MEMKIQPEVLAELSLTLIKSVKITLYLELFSKRFFI